MTAVYFHYQSPQDNDKFSILAKKSEPMADALFTKQPATEPPITKNTDTPPVATQSFPPAPEPLPALEITPPAVTKPAPPKAQFALIIDDMGYHKKVGDALIDLPLDITFSFLPFTPHAGSQLSLARERNRDILLHLPMEATDKKWDLGPGAILTAMTKDEMHDTILKDLNEIPDAIGINNHMGSLFTENKKAMRAFMELTKEHNLFFLDSQTSSRSVAKAVAKELGMLTISRNVFLDNQQDKDQIKKQLDYLIFLAKKHGTAIGIAHPHQNTLDVLRDYLQHQDNDVALVNLHALLQYRYKTTAASKQQ